MGFYETYMMIWGGLGGNMDRIWPIYVVFPHIIGLFRVHICGFSHFFSINYSLLINGVHFQLNRCVN